MNASFDGADSATTSRRPSSTEAIGAIFIPEPNVVPLQTAIAQASRRRSVRLPALSTTHVSGAASVVAIARRYAHRYAAVGGGVRGESETKRSTFPPSPADKMFTNQRVPSVPL